MKPFARLIPFVFVGALLSACSGPTLSDDQKKLAENSLKFAEAAVKVFDSAPSSEDVEAELGKLLTGDAKAGFDFVAKAEGVGATKAEDMLTSEGLALISWYEDSAKARHTALQAALAKAGKEKPELFVGPIAKRLWSSYADGSAPKPWEHIPAAKPATEPAAEPEPAAAPEPEPAAAPEPEPAAAPEPEPAAAPEPEPAAAPEPEQEPTP